MLAFTPCYGYLDARNPFQAELIGNLQRAADKVRLDILLHGVFRGASTDDIFGELVNGRIDGLFINTSAGDPLVARLQNASLPVVAIADTVPGIASVVADDAGGTRLLLDFLWERGHRRIAYVRPQSRYASVERRVEAFGTWAGEKELSSAQAPVYEIPYEFAEAALNMILALPRTVRPTAVCCWNDVAAFDLLMHCTKRGVSVPGDLSVAGFDGLLTDPRLRSRALVTMGASWEEITEAAVSLLTCQIERRVAAASRRNTKEDEFSLPLVSSFPVNLIAGDTV